MKKRRSYDVSRCRVLQPNELSGVVIVRRGNVPRGRRW